MLTAIGDVMREAYRRKWLTTRDGNCAVSRGKCFYITPSGWRKTIIVPEHIIKYKKDKDGIYVPDRDVKPSIELDSHMELHNLSKKKPVSTLHLHPTNVVAAMYAGYDLQKLCADFPELHRYTKVGPTVGIHKPGAKELATETVEKMTMKGKIIYDIVGQDRHGVMAIARSPWDAFEHIERLDHICEIALKSGVKPK